MFKGDKYTLKYLAEAEWCRRREFGVSKKEFPIQDELELNEEHICRKPKVT
jgi:hypothetical protein